MKKNLFGVVSKTAIIFLEILAVLVALVALLIALLSWRLQSGPIQISFLTPVLHEAFNQNELDLGIDFEDVKIAWGGADNPIDIVLTDLRIKNSAGMKMARIDEVSTSLSLKSLLFGKVRPATLFVHSPRLYLVRNPEGQLMVNVADKEEVTQRPEQPQPAETKTAGATNLIKTIIRNLAGEGDDQSFTVELEAFGIKHAKMIFNDLYKKQVWNIPDLSVTLRRSINGFEGDLDFQLKTETSKTKGHGSIRHHVLNDVVSSKGDGETLIELSVEGMPTQDLITRVPELDFLKGSKALLNLDFKLSFLENLDLTYAYFGAHAKQGTLKASDAFVKDIEFDGLDVIGNYDDANGKAVLESISLQQGDFILTANGEWDTAKEQENLFLKAGFNSLHSSKVYELWPEDAAKDARDWVSVNVGGGPVENGRFELVGHFDPFTDPKNKEFDLIKIDGGFDYQDLNVTFLPKFPPVEKLKGKAWFNLEEFGFDIAEGRVEEMPFESAKVVINGLSNEDQFIDIKVKNINGSAEKVARIIDLEPLGYIQAIGQKPSNFVGSVKGDLSLNFPLYDDLELEQVEFGTDIQLDKFSLENVFQEKRLHDASLTLKANSNELEASGSGKLEGMNVPSLKWIEKFSKGSAFNTKVEASAVIDAAQVEQFGFDATPYAQGNIPTGLVYQSMSGGKETIDLNLDLTPAVFSLEEFMAYKKEAGVQAVGKIQLNMVGGDVKWVEIQSIQSKDEPLDIQGHIGLNTDMSLKEVRFPTVLAGQNDLSVNGKQRPDGYLHLKVKAKKLDAGTYFDSGDKGTDQKKTFKPKPNEQSLKMGLKADQLIAAKGKELRGVQMYLEQRQNRFGFDRLEMDANIAGGDMKVRYGTASDTGMKQLRMRSNKAGESLVALGIAEDTRGGSMSLSMDEKFRDTGILDGRLLIKDMNAVKVPSLARLINAISLKGLQELLASKQGLKFDRIAANVEWTGRTDSREEVIKVRDGQTKSASLGLTFEGNIKPDSDRIDMGGTIVPVSDLNKFLGNIPVFGDVLTMGTGGALFAATYSMKGSLDDPSVSVNPLAALAPGFLRKIFFEKNYDIDDTNIEEFNAPSEVQLNE